MINKPIRRLRRVDLSVHTVFRTKPPLLMKASAKSLSILQRREGLSPKSHESASSVPATSSKALNPKAINP